MEVSQENVQEQAPEIVVSVVIVSRNCAAALRGCLAALEKSTIRESMEIVVADNASHDGSERIDHEFPAVAPLRMQHHIGLTRARNIALRTAKGEFLLLLSPDVIVAPDTVAKLVERARNDSSALAVCPILADPVGKPASRAYRLPDAAAVAAAWADPASLPAAPLGDYIELHDGKALLIRRNSVQGMNYLDEKFGEHWSDVELAFQVRRAGKKIALDSSIRATLDTQPLWKPSTTGERSAYAADAASGAAAYIGKRSGFAASLAFRVKLIFGALVRVLTFQDSGFNSGLLMGLLNGSKIDGTDKSL